MLIKYIAEDGLLLNAGGGLILSPDNPVDYLAQIWSILSTKQAETLNNF